VKGRVVVGVGVTVCVWGGVTVWGLVGVIPGFWKEDNCPSVAVLEQKGQRLG